VSEAAAFGYETRKECLKELRNKINHNLGLFYSDERLEMLATRLNRAAKEAGLSPVEYISRLLDEAWNRNTISSLVKNLTVPETYFFRDEMVFKVLESNIIPDIVQRSITQNEKITVWSTSCATGEEPYSVAIYLHRLLPANLLSKVEILATDINEDYLARAAEGIYRKWSLRATPEYLRHAYFSEVAPGKFQVVEQIRNLVKFEYANLVSLNSDFQKETVDLLLCRNTLIYFSKTQADAVMNSLSLALRAKSWLILAPAEVSLAPPEHFELIRHCGAIVFRKRDVVSAQLEIPPKLPLAPAPVALTPRTKPRSRTKNQEKSSRNQISSSTLGEPKLQMAKRLVLEGRYDEAASICIALMKDSEDKNIEAATIVAEWCSRRGNLSEALSLIDSAILREPLEVGLYFRKAMILHEKNDVAGAIEPLKQSLFLDPQFVLGEFTLSSYFAKLGNQRQASIHLRNTETLLSALPADSILPESDGMSAGQLLALVRSHSYKPP